MKIISIYFSLLLLLGVAITSCEDYRLDGMVDPTLYIVKSGEQKVTMYNVGLPYVYDLGVYRSGMGDGLASVSLTVLDEAELAAFNAENNTNYKMVTEDCYTITSRALQVDGEKSSVTTAINFDPGKILALPGYAADQYALPVKLINSSEAISEDKSTAVIVINVIDPMVYLGITGTEIMTFSDVGSSIIELELPVKMDYENIFDLEVTLEEKEQLMIDYNTANGTVYELLPEGSYEIDPNPISIAKGISSGVVTITVDRDKLTYGSYMVPLQLASVSKYSISSTANTCLFALNYEAALLDRSDWEVIDFDSEEAVAEGGLANGLAKHIIDDDLSTYWHSAWYGAPAEEAALPYHITVDMKEEVTVTQIDLVRRINNADNIAGEFYTSTDNVNWTKIGTYTMALTNDPQPFSVTKSKARYLKYVMTESRRGNNGSLAEMYVRGF
ncbi:BT_3987 domain-containing protein [Saccharicrinis sp. GN24d3]|uniref:BT_3987 domain-containing protein n=1 Tax=Saccharicrinis sp. GN24d3 TaxID=3458416 RepID=UPI004035D368